MSLKLARSLKTKTHDNLCFCGFLQIYKGSEDHCLLEERVRSIHFWQDTNLNLVCLHGYLSYRNTCR